MNFYEEDTDEIEDDVDQQDIDEQDIDSDSIVDKIESDAWSLDWMLLLDIFS